MNYFVLVVVFPSGDHMNLITILSQELDRPTRAIVLGIASLAVVLVALTDYLIGYEISLALLFIVPIAIATWYVGRQAGLALATLASVSRYIADIAAGHPYSNSLIPIWNSLIRLSIFFVIVILFYTVRSGVRKLSFPPSTGAHTAMQLTGLAANLRDEDSKRRLNELATELFEQSKNTAPAPISKTLPDGQVGQHVLVLHSSFDASLDNLEAGALKRCRQCVERAERLGIESMCENPCHTTYCTVIFKNLAR